MGISQMQAPAAGVLILAHALSVLRSLNCTVQLEAAWGNHEADELIYHNLKGLCFIIRERLMKIQFNKS